MNTTLTVDLNQLADVLSAVKMARPVSFSSFTEPKLKRTGNPFGLSGIRKLSRVQAFLGADYERAIQRRELKEGAEVATFQAKPHAWADYVSPALRKHRKTGELYLACHILRADTPTYLYQRSAGFWSPIDAAEVVPFLPPDQTEAMKEHQGIEDVVYFRMYRLDSLCSLALDTRRYRIRRRFVSSLAAPISESLKVAPEALVSKALRAAVNGTPHAKVAPRRDT